MKTLLLISCSPRGDKSHSYELAQYFTDNFMRQSSDSWCIEPLNLWDLSLPAIDLNVSNAKYAIMSGKPLSVTEQSSWKTITNHCDYFNKADVIVIALPMWNFGIPYILKHYIDVITQPGISFNWSIEAGYVPIVKSKRCVVVSSSAADFRFGSGNEHSDFSVPYLDEWLKVYFGHKVDHLDFSPTALADIDVLEIKKKAFEQADALVTTFSTSLDQSYNPN